MNAEIDLNSKKAELERKKIIGIYIDDAIKLLNSNTCTIQEQENVTLCDRNIEDGLRSVYFPFIENPQNLLETPKAKFTVGIALEMFAKLPHNFGNPQRKYELKFGL